MEIYRFSPHTLFYWLVSFSIFEWIAIFLILSIFKNSKILNDYYTKIPSWVAVSGDFIYTTAILLIAQMIFQWLEPIFSKYTRYKLPIFIVIMLITQWISDLIFALFVSTRPIGFSKYTTFFQKYIKKAKFIAVIGDTIWIASWILMTVICMKYIPLHLACLILAISLFMWLVVKW